MSADASLGALRFVREADVHKGGVHAGRLERADDGAVVFRYLDGYGGPPLASTLPVSSEPVRAGGAGLPSFFAGLLPEGHRLTIVRRATKTSADDELTLLLAVGNDTPGDVQVVPAGEAPVEPAALASEDPAALDFRALTSGVDRHGLPGVQAKASATMLTTPIASRRGRAILKIDPLDHPHLVENEALHLTAARALKLPVAQHAVVRDREGVLGLLVTRFDRVIGTDGSVHRFAMEDAAQLLGVLPSAKYAVDTEDVVRAVARAASAPMVATRNLYLQFLFAWLTGNGDLHAKNVSLLQAADGLWSVAPIYDIPCTALYRDMSMALPIAGRTKGLRAEHWEEFADAIGLPPRAAASANRVALAAAAAVDLAALPIDGSPLRGAERELRMRRARFDG